MKEPQELASCHLTPDRFGGLKVVEGYLLQGRQPLCQLR